MTVELSPLDSVRFGVVTARAFAEVPADAARIKAFCDANGVQLLIVRCPTTAISTVHAFERDGGSVMECIVRYRLDLRKHVLEDASGLNWIRDAGPEDADAIAGVAARAFAGYEGHYHADPRLPRAGVDAAYRDWVYRSCVDATLHERIIVACDGDAVTGFVILRRNSAAEMEAVLLAVAPEAQGSGVPYAIGIKTLRWAADAGARRLIVCTHVNNVAMQRTLVRHRFEVASSSYTMHLWFDRATETAQNRSAPAP